MQIFSHLTSRHLSSQVESLAHEETVCCFGGRLVLRFFGVACRFATGCGTRRRHALANMLSPSLCAVAGLHQLFGGSLVAQSSVPLGCPVSVVVCLASFVAQCQFECSIGLSSVSCGVLGQLDCAITLCCAGIAFIRPVVPSRGQVPPAVTTNESEELALALLHNGVMCFASYMFTCFVMKPIAPNMAGLCAFVVCVCACACSGVLVSTLRIGIAVHILLLCQWRRADRRSP